MGKQRFSEEQIAYALRQADGGSSVTEIIRKLGVSEQTFYRWKKKFAGTPEEGDRKPQAGTCVKCGSCDGYERRSCSQPPTMRACSIALPSLSAGPAVDRAG
jgi:hypothetical protein